MVIYGDMVDAPGAHSSNPVRLHVEVLQKKAASAAIRVGSEDYIVPLQHLQQFGYPDGAKVM